MVNILETKETDLGLQVSVEGFSHAQPVFEKGLSQEEIQTKVNEWAINQSEIDSINNGTATQEIIDKHAPKPAPINVMDILEIIENGEEKILKVKTSIMAENIYTESKVLDKNKDYSKEFDKEMLSNKETHKNKKLVNGKLVLDLEQRVADLEGAIAELLKKK